MFSGVLKTKFISVLLSLCFVVTGLFVASLVMTESGYVFVGVILWRSTYILYFIFCVLTYIAVIVKVLVSRRNVQTTNADGPQQRTLICVQLSQQGYVMLFLITSTYLMFVVLPVLLEYNICTEEANRYSTNIFSGISFPLNNISDALIYVFCDRDIRNHLKNIFKRNEQNDNSNRDNIEMNQHGSTHSRNDAKFITTEV